MSKRYFAEQTGYEIWVSVQHFEPRISIYLMGIVVGQTVEQLSSRTDAMHRVMYIAVDMKNVAMDSQRAK